MSTHHATPAAAPEPPKFTDPKEADPSAAKHDPTKKRKPRAPVTWEQLGKKLNTKEDRGYFHKIFGTLALASFAYRYLWMWPRTGELGLQFDALGIATMAVHTLLSSSSIIFRVPLKRIPRQPTMIWEEYRLHAIVFTFRCALVYGLAIYSQAQGGAFVAHDSAPTGIAPTFKGQALRLAVVLAMHVAADLISVFWGDPRQTTVRGDASRPPKMELVRHLSLVYASYQFLALGSHLLPHGPRAMDLAYNTLIAIQSSAFCMTLNRKGLIRWQTHAAVYGICLAISAAYILAAVRSWSFFGAILVAFFVRTQLRLNKYVIWVAFAFSWVYGAQAAYVCAFATAALAFMKWNTPSLGAAPPAEDAPHPGAHQGQEVEDLQQVREETKKNE